MAPKESSQRSPASRSRPQLSSVLSTGPGTPGSPHTPLLGRSVSSQFGSPSLYRTEEEPVIYEIGSRHVRAGFAGESAPRCILQFGPEANRRAGDYQRWAQQDTETTSKSRGSSVADWTLWRIDLRNLDLGLVEDRLERALREVHTKHILLDTRTRKAVIALPPCLPHPLINVVLHTIFTSVHQPPSVTLFSGPLLSTVAGGLRSALVLDIGWHESTVTAIYEYREVTQHRTDRAASMLCRATLKVLRSGGDEPSTTKAHSIPFSTIEDVMTRMTWCRGMTDAENPNRGTQDGQTRTVHVDGSSTALLKLPFDLLSEPAERVFFEAGKIEDRVDDHHLPLHVIVWKTLLALPLDVRSVCVSRIVMTGGPSSMPGLKARLLQEVEELVKANSWDPVINYGSATTARNTRLQERNANMSVRLKAKDNAVGSGIEFLNGSENGGIPASELPQENDDIMEKIHSDSSKVSVSQVQSSVRGVETMGSWAGASLIASMRIEGAIEIKKEDYLKHGLHALNGAI